MTNPDVNELFTILEESLIRAYDSKDYTYQASLYRGIPCTPRGQLIGLEIIRRAWISQLSPEIYSSMRPGAYTSIVQL